MGIEEIKLEKQLKEINDIRTLVSLRKQMIGKQIAKQLLKEEIKSRISSFELPRDDKSLFVAEQSRKK